MSSVYRTVKSSLCKGVIVAYLSWWVAIDKYLYGISVGLSWKKNQRMNIDFLSCTFWTSHLLMPKTPKVLYGSSTLNKIIYLSCSRHFVLKRCRLLKRFVRDATKTVKQLLKVSRMASKWAPGCIVFNLLATIRSPRGAQQSQIIWLKPISLTMLCRKPGYCKTTDVVFAIS